LAALGRSATELLDGLDVAISLGGDGTMLRTVDLVSRAGVAVVGVNVGQMGYLTEVEPADLQRAVERIVTGAFRGRGADAAPVTVVSGETSSGVWWALNEAVLEKPIPGGWCAWRSPSTAARSPRMPPTASSLRPPPARRVFRSPRAGRSSRRGTVACSSRRGVTPHALRPLARARPGEELRFTIVDARSVVLTSTGRSSARSKLATKVVCTGGPQPARILTFGPRDFHQS